MNGQQGVEVFVDVALLIRRERENDLRMHQMIRVRPAGEAEDPSLMLDSELDRELERPLAVNSRAMTAAV